MKIAGKSLPDVELNNIRLKDAYDLKDILELTSWNVKENQVKEPLPSFSPVNDLICCVSFFKEYISIGMINSFTCSKYCIFEGSLEEAKNKYPSLFNIPGTAY